MPETLPLDAGGAACVNVIGDRVLLVVPQAGAVLTRAECEHLGDLLWHAGVRAEPPKSMQAPGFDPRVPRNFASVTPTGMRAKPITSVDDERVRNDR